MEKSTVAAAGHTKGSEITENPTVLEWACLEVVFWFVVLAKDVCVRWWWCCGGVFGE